MKFQLRIPDSSIYTQVSILPKKGAVILPVILKPCTIEATALQQFQAFNDKPLSSKRSNDKDMLWADLVRYVVTLGRDIEYE